MMTREEAEKMAAIEDIGVLANEQIRLALIGAGDESYDAADDFSRSIDACYAEVRARIRAGGRGWEPR